MQNAGPLVVIVTQYLQSSRTSCPTAGYIIVLLYVVYIIVNKKLHNIDYGKMYKSFLLIGQSNNRPTVIDIVAH